MSNSIKYSTGSETLALKKGNFYIGTGDVGKGPSSSTGYFDGVSPVSGGYVIYVRNSSGKNLIYGASNDSQLILITNRIAGASYTTVNECLVYFAGQTDKVVLNRDYESIVTNGLVLNLDAGFTPSYPRSNTTWYDTSLFGNNGTLTNGPTYSSDNGGIIVFDGTNDYVNCGNTQSATITGNSVSLESWANYNISQEDWKGIIYKANGNSSGYQLFIDSAERVAFGVITTAGFLRPNAGFTLSQNTWNHIVGSYDGSNMRIYVNGILYNTTPHSGNILTSTTNLHVGMSFGGEEFPGYIAVARIYNRGLNTSEVLQNYNAQKGRFGL